jgi:hypothetical protein
MNRDMELAQQLVKAKRNVKVQGKDAGIALRIAVNKDMELAKQLLEAKAEVQDSDGGVALVIGMNRDMELGQLLLEAKEDVKVQDSDGEVAMGVTVVVRYGAVVWYITATGGSRRLWRYRQMIVRRLGWSNNIKGQCRRVVIIDIYSQYNIYILFKSGE